MGNPLTTVHRGYLGAALVMTIGVGAMIEGARFSVGTLQRMGPGFFPIFLGAILSLIGLGIGLVTWLDRAPVAPSGERGPPHLEWRGWLCIVCSFIAFIGLGHHGGLVPATAALVFVSALGDRKNTVKTAVALTLVMLVICVVVFWWALKINFPLFRWE